MSMKKKIFLGLLGVLLVFVAGAFYGRVSKQDVVISSSTGGASYAGGFKSDAAAPASGIRSVAGPAPTNVVVVKDGESILAAVKAAPKGTIIRVMPGTYHETVYVDKDDIRIIGVIDQGKRAVLDGEKKLNDASCTRATTSSPRTSRSATTRATGSWARPATTSRSATT
jgi:pectin methylesterase-like acyl-CoA thioesterase